jgi:hypothetical protein
LAALGATPLQAAQSAYDQPVVLAAGTVAQMARAAKNAVNCGYEVVTVRPWQPSDPTGGNSPPARSLIVQVQHGADLNKMRSCFYPKVGVDESGGK